MKLPPTLTLDTAADALRALQAEPAGAGGAALTVDASALARFDTAALALLLQARRQAQAAGRRSESTRLNSSHVSLSRMPSSA